MFASVSTTKSGVKAGVFSFLVEGGNQMKIFIDGETFKCKAFDEFMKLLREIDEIPEEDVDGDALGCLLVFAVGKHCESKIEQMFFLSAFPRISFLLPQVQFEMYRFDFGILGTNVLIELDGHDYHKTKEQRTSDAKRQRYLEKKGFRVIRFTGSEIYRDLEGCVKETEEALLALGATGE